LVFDIDGDVLEKAIAEILPLMTRNGYVLSKKWPIPLTCDVEMGHDWSVPWDLNSMRYKEVRFVGNKKYKDAKKLPEGQKWEVLPTFPDDLKSFFEVETQVVEIPKEKPPVVEQMSLAPVEISPILAVPANGLFEYKLKEPLKARTLRVLADVIIRCKGRGTHQLKVLTQDGVDLTAVLYQHKPFYGKPVNVNANEFYYLANAMGL
jgi:hypothetical protein